MLLTSLEARVAVQALERLLAGGQVVPITALPFAFMYLNALRMNAYEYEDAWSAPPLGPQDERSAVQRLSQVWIS